MVGQEPTNRCGTRVMSSDRLVRMANQIAANFAARGEERATAETAQHILDYWNPLMRQALLAADPHELSDIARSAVRTLSGR